MDLHRTASGTAGGDAGLAPATPMDVAAAGVPEGGDAGSLNRSSARGPEDRKRLVVASMSPEDLVLCVDVGPEMTSEWVGAGAGGATTSRMLVVKTALRGFVRRKASFNPKHRFAVVALGDGVTVVRSMTSDVRSVVEAIDRLQPVQAQEMEPVAEGNGENHNPLDPPFDLTGLLRCIAERFPPPRDAAAALERNREGGSANALEGGVGARAGAGATSQVRPIVRAVLFFGRSYTCPIVPPSGADKPALLSHRRFSLDCLYVYRSPAEEGVICQDVFDSIAALETSAGGGHSYFLACGHNLKFFNANMAALLAHPAQRDFQTAFFDKLEVPGGSVTGGGAVARVDSNHSSGGGGGGGGLGGGGNSVNGSVS
eukprot:g10192.t1